MQGQVLVGTQSFMKLLNLLKCTMKNVIKPELEWRQWEWGADWNT